LCYKGTLWNEFEGEGKYKTNETHKEALCKWCINAKVVELHQEDTLAQKKDATVLIQTRDTLCVEGEYFILIVSLRQPPNTSPTSLILSMISSTSLKEKGHLGTYFGTTELQP
jgi:hypothetical protein